MACKVDESPSPPPPSPSSTELLLGEDTDANEDVKVVVVSASVAAGVIVVDPQMNEQGQILGMGSAACTPLSEKSGTRPNKKTRSKEKIYRRKKAFVVYQHWVFSMRRFLLLRLLKN